MSTLDAKNITVNRTYDALNRLLSTSYPTSSLNVTFSYDSAAVSFGIGRKTGVTDASGTTILHYDRRGLPKIEVKTIGGVPYTTQYTFDKDGNRTQVLYPTADPLQRQGQADFTFDANDRLSSITTKVNGIATTVASNIQYKPFGPRTRIDFGNGLVDNRTYDSRYQVGAWTLGGLLSYTHSFNNDGNLVGRTDNLNAANNRVFGYDGAHRLTQASGPWGAGTGCAGSVSYTYDKNGNRLCKGEGAAATNYTYTGGTNQLASSAGAEVASYSYDLNGNASGDATHTYQYNDADRLGTVDNGATATYTYDGGRHRVVRLAAGATTYYFYDPEGNLLTEVNIDDASGRDYLYGGNTPLARVDWSLEQPVDDALRCSSSTPNVHLDWTLFPAASNTYSVRRKLFNDLSKKTFAGNVVLAAVQDPTRSYDDPTLGDSSNYLYRVFRRALVETLSYYHADDLNTPLAMTGSGATFVWRAELLPFGGLQALTVSTTSNNLRFPGQVDSPETGLHDNLNRWYDRKTGRYTQTDPIFLAGYSPYTYALSDPVGVTDPHGLLPAGFSADDTCLICTVYAEARGRSAPCQQAVASAIMNRLGKCRGRGQPTTVCDIVSANKSGTQFDGYYHPNYANCATCQRAGALPELGPVIKALESPFPLDPPADYYSNNEPSVIHSLKSSMRKGTILDPVPYPSCTTFAFFTVRRDPFVRPPNPGYCR